MRILLKILKFGLVAGLVTGFLGVVTLLIAYLVIRPTLPEVDMLRDVQLQVPLRIYTRDGRLMQVFGEKHRSPVALEDIPACIKNAFLAGEDARFYEHPGVDYQGVLRAVWYMVKTGDMGPGGSTITQQLARDFGFVSRKKLLTRKLKEIFLALKMERELTKDEILELYLNKIYLGNRSYGVAAAAQAYYGKRLDELNVAECAMIAALPKAPSRINPISNPPRAIERRNYVLGRLRELNHIDETTYQQAVNADDFAFPHEPQIEANAPYAAEMVRQAVLDRLGPDAYTGGYVVHTTFRADLQQTAAEAVLAGLVDYDRRHGYRGPAAHFDLPPDATPTEWNELLDRFETIGGMLPALVVEADEQLALAYLADGQTVSLDLEAVDWARPYKTVDRVGERPDTVTDVLTAGDVIRVSRNQSGGWELAQIPEVEGALVSLDPTDGALLAVVGGFDFNKSKYNRATQARRQPGSSFKPFVYAAALTQGFTTATLVNDAPVVFRSEALERAWRPENYSQQFYGPTRLREGMVNSRNLVSIRVLRDVGVDYVWNYVRRFGFSPEEIPRDLSMALGSGAVHPITMARAYGVIANGGFLIEPYFIERIEDGDGQIVFQAKPPVACPQCPETAGRLQPAAAQDGSAAGEDESGIAPRTIDPATNYLITSLLQDVVKRGTGAKAMELGRNDLSGKTGTTNEQRDAWFSGFNHAVVTTAWVGFDNPTPLGRGEVGGRAALPIWMQFMERALEGIPERKVEPPSDVVFARINPDTGLLARADDPTAVLEVFRRGQLPEMAPQGMEDQRDSVTSPYDIF